jgi:hypothetical protein
MKHVPFLFNKIAQYLDKQAISGAIKDNSLLTKADTPAGVQLGQQIAAEGAPARQAAQANRQATIKDFDTNKRSKAMTPTAGKGLANAQALQAAINARNTKRKQVPLYARTNNQQRMQQAQQAAANRTGNYSEYGVVDPNKAATKKRYADWAAQVAKLEGNTGQPVGNTSKQLQALRSAYNMKDPKQRQRAIAGVQRDAMYAKQRADRRTQAATPPIPSRKTPQVSINKKLSNESIAKYDEDAAGIDFNEAIAKEEKVKKEEAAKEVQEQAAKEIMDRASTPIKKQPIELNTPVTEPIMTESTPTTTPPKVAPSPPVVNEAEALEDEQTITNLWNVWNTNKSKFRSEFAKVSPRLRKMFREEVHTKRFNDYMRKAPGDEQTITNLLNVWNTNKSKFNSEFAKVSPRLQKMFKEKVLTKQFNDYMRKSDIKRAKNLREQEMTKKRADKAKELAFAQSFANNY